MKKAPVVLLLIGFALAALGRLFDVEALIILGTFPIGIGIALMMWPITEPKPPINKGD